MLRAPSWVLRNRHPVGLWLHRDFGTICGRPRCREGLPQRKEERRCPRAPACSVEGAGDRSLAPSTLISEHDHRLKGSATRLNVTSPRLPGPFGVWPVEGDVDDEHQDQLHGSAANPRGRGLRWLTIRGGHLRTRPLRK